MSGPRPALFGFALAVIAAISVAVPFVRETHTWARAESRGLCGVSVALGPEETRARTNPEPQNIRRVLDF